MVKSSETFIQKVSKFISAIFNPINSLIFFYLVYSSKNYSLLESVQMFLPLFLIMILPVSAWIFWNVKKKNCSNFDVSNRIQRKSLYFFIGGAITVYLIYMYLRFEVIDWVLFFLLALIFLMQISNYFIKSSMHTALNVFVAALFFTISPLLGGIWLLISILVGFSRIILKRHSPAEVFMGALLATIVSFIYLYSFIQKI